MRAAPSAQQPTGVPALASQPLPQPAPAPAAREPPAPSGDEAKLTQLMGLGYTRVSVHTGCAVGMQGMPWACRVCAHIGCASSSVLQGCTQGARQGEWVCSVWLRESGHAGCAGWPGKAGGAEASVLLGLGVCKGVLREPALRWLQLPCQLARQRLAGCGCRQLGPYMWAHQGHWWCFRSALCWQCCKHTRWVEFVCVYLWIRLICQWWWFGAIMSTYQLTPPKLNLFLVTACAWCRTRRHRRCVQQEGMLRVQLHTWRLGQMPCSNQVLGRHYTCPQEWRGTPRYWQQHSLSLTCRIQSTLLRCLD